MFLINSHRKSHNVHYIHNHIYVWHICDCFHSDITGSFFIHASWLPSSGKISCAAVDSPAFRYSKWNMMWNWMKINMSEADPHLWCHSENDSLNDACWSREAQTLCDVMCQKFTYPKCMLLKNKKLTHFKCVCIFYVISSNVYVHSLVHNLRVFFTPIKFTVENNLSFKIKK